LNCQYQPKEIPPSLLNEINEGQQHLEKLKESKEFNWSSIIDFSNKDGQGTCPPAHQITALGATIRLNYDPFCDLAPLVSFCLIFASSIVSIRVLSSVT
jgi:hypothetical protein